MECITCGKNLNNTTNYFKVLGNNGGRSICKECAQEIGIDNSLKAKLYTNIFVVKKYVEIHPEAQFRYDKLKDEINCELKEMTMSVLDKSKQKILDVLKPSEQEEIKLKIEKKKKVSHFGCKKKEQVKCVCRSCENIFYFGDLEMVKNLYNILNANVYSLNQLKDLKQCPKCGSRAITQTKEYYWVDKKGNCVDVQ